MATISSNIALTKTQEYFNKISSITSSKKDRESVYRFVQGLYDLNFWNNIVCWLLKQDQNTGTGVIVYSLGGLGMYTGLVINTGLRPFVLEQDPSLALLQEDGELLFATFVSSTNVWSSEGFISTSENSEYIYIPNGAGLLSKPNVTSGSVFKSTNTVWNDVYYWLYGNNPEWSDNIQNGGGFLESNGVGLVNQMRNQNLIDSLNTQNASNGTYQFFTNVTSEGTTKDFLNKVEQKNRTIPLMDGNGPAQGPNSYQIGRLSGQGPTVAEGKIALHWVLSDIAATNQQIEQLYTLYKETIGKNII